MTTTNTTEVAAGLAAIDAATLAYTISQRLTTLHELPAETQHAHARGTLTMCRELATQAGLIATSLYADNYHQQMQAARAELALWRDGEQ